MIRIPRRKRFVAEVKATKSGVYISCPKAFMEEFWEENPMVEVFNLGHGKLFIKAYHDIRRYDGTSEQAPDNNESGGRS